MNNRIKNNGRESCTLRYPMWFVVYLCAGELILLLATGWYILQAVDRGLEAGSIVKTLLLIVVVLMGIWFIARLAFYSVTAAAEGLETSNLFGKKRLVSWDDIVEVRNPNLRIPRDAVYVISRTGRRIVLVRSMKAYDRMIKLIGERAENLRKF